MIQKIESKVRATRRRLRMLRFYKAALWGMSAATTLAALAFLADKAYPLPWSVEQRCLGWGIGMAFGVLCAAGYALFSRLTLFESALALDLRLGLKERFSSAILLRDRADDPAVAALLEDTARFCARLRPQTDFPFLLSSRHAHHVWPFVALAVIHFLVPQAKSASMAGPEKAPDGERLLSKSERERQAEQLEKIAKRIKETEEGVVADEISRFAKDLEKLAHEIRAGDKAPRLALAEMSRISDEVRLERTDLAKKFDGFQKVGPPAHAQHTGDMQRALQRNEFEKAAAMARDLAEKFEADSTASQKEQAAAELENLAQQLNRDQPAMAQALEQAAQAMRDAARQQSQGDQGAAQQSLQQARQALEKAASEMDSQADATQLMAQLDQLQMSAEQQRRQMAAAMCEGSGAGGSQPQSAGQQGTDTGEMGEAGQLGQGRQSTPQGDVAQGSQGGARSCNQCGSALGEGGMCSNSGCAGSNTSTRMWQPGDSQTEGSGMGGPGRGRGGQAPFDDSVTPEFIDTRPPHEKNPGEIIAVMNIDGPALRGESRVEYQNVLTEYRQKADDAIHQEQIPVSLQPLVRDYFDSINPHSQEP